MKQNNVVEKLYFSNIVFWLGLIGFPTMSAFIGNYFFELYGLVLGIIIGLIAAKKLHRKIYSLDFTECSTTKL